MWGKSPFGDGSHYYAAHTRRRSIELTTDMGRLLGYLYLSMLKYKNYKNLVNLEGTSTCTHYQ